MNSKMYCTQKNVKIPSPGGRVSVIVRTVDMKSGRGF